MLVACASHAVIPFADTSPVLRIVVRIALEAGVTALLAFTSSTRMRTLPLHAQRLTSTVDAIPDLSDLTRVRRVVAMVDVVESVRLMESFESAFIARWRAFVQDVRSRILPAHAGRLVKSLGDGLLLEFRHPHQAMPAVLEVREAMVRLNAGAAPGSEIFLRIGVHVADVVVDELDIYGQGVNLAARLTGLARPGEIVVSSDVRDGLVDGLDGELEDMGDCHLKHVAQPVRAYRHTVGGSAGPLALGLAAAEDLRPVVAVFVTREGETRNFWIGEAWGERLVASLSRSSHLRVISRMSSTTVAARDPGWSTVRQLLGAGYLVNLTARADGERLRVDVQIVETQRGTTLWSERRDGRVAGLWAPDDEALESVAEGIFEALMCHQIERARWLPLPTLESHAILLSGIALMHRFTQSDFVRAGELLEALVERVPRHAAPLAWRARWHLFRIIQGWSTDPEVDRRSALALSRRALDVDASSSIALTVAGSVEVAMRKDLDAAKRLYESALDHNPNEPLAWLLSGTAHAFSGDGAQAVSRTEHAMRLSPLDPMRFFYEAHAAGAAITAGRYEAAIALALRSLKANRRHLSTLRTLAIGQAMLGQLDAAKDTVREILVHDPSLTVEAFIARSPGGTTEQGRRFGDALGAAGLPRGRAT